MPSSPIRHDIQGLRALAILSVLLYHLAPNLLPGGFVGVDIFFVISGFVITATIRRQQYAGTFSIAGFYRKRIRRILPPLFLMMAAVLLVGWFLFPPYWYLQLAKSALATTVFGANFFFLRNTGYFDLSSTSLPLLHTWSLAVEEQFYLGFPLLLLLLQRYLPRRIVAALSLLALGSLALSIYLVHPHPFAAFYLAPSRAWELLLGAVLALRPPPRNLQPSLLTAASATGIALTAASFFLLQPDSPFPGVAALAPCLGAALLLYTGILPGSPLTRLLSIPPLVFVGNISYALYLWHWPILVFLRTTAPISWQANPPLLLLSAALAAFAAASLSWYLLERPLLQSPLPRYPWFRLAFAASSISLALTAALVLLHGIPGRFPAPAQTIFATSNDFNPRRSVCEGDETHRIPYDQTCLYGAPNTTPDTAIFSDSQGAELAWALGERFTPLRRSLLGITTSACPPSTSIAGSRSPQCALHNAETLQRLITDSRIHTAILAASYRGRDSYTKAMLLAGLADTLRQLLAANKHVILVYPIPHQDFDPPSVLGMAWLRREPMETLGLPTNRFLATNQEALTFLDALPSYPALTRVYPHQLLCTNGLCRVYSPQWGFLYMDHGHLSIAGARMIAQAIPISSPTQ